MGPTGTWPRRDLLSHRTAATPDATAVVAAADGRSWEYARLDRIVGAAAAAVSGRLDEITDVPRHEGRPRIVVTARTEPRFVVALFASWRAGAQVVPVAPDASAEDRRERLAALDPALVLTENPDRDRWTGAGDVPVRSLDVVVPPLDGDAGPEPADPSPDVAPWSPDETTLVLFTSGTTGSPKGVRLTHRNLVTSAFGSATRLGLDPDERWFDCLPTTHMGGLAPIIRSVCYGTTVVLQSAFDATTTAETLADHDATAVSLVPTQLRRLLDAGWTPPASLRFVLLGGAPAGRDLLADCTEAGVPVCPTYGTTETASQITTVAPGANVDEPHIVGSPLVVAEVTIVDRDDGTPVEPGEVGELVVDGPIVSPGYLYDDATAATFGEYGLHTGDLASRDESRRLRIHGRVDDAIQTGGETVHPWRVADALDEHPDVDAATVVGLPDPEWGERVAALVVPAGEQRPSSDGLRAHARERLAPYEVPKTVRLADELPRTASGTVDRAAVCRRLRE